MFLFKLLDCENLDLDCCKTTQTNRFLLDIQVATGTFLDAFYDKG